MIQHNETQTETGTTRMETKMTTEMTETTKVDVCRNCEQNLMLVDGGWWHYDEVMALHFGVCGDPQPVSWRNERGLE